MATTRRHDIPPPEASEMVVKDSSVVPVTEPLVLPFDASEGAFHHVEPLDAATLHLPLDVRTVEMMRRSELGDPIATLALAESILLEVPTHGLAAACHAESARALQAFFESAPSPPPLLAALDVHARLLLARTDGRSTLASLLPTGAARATALRALHDLMRLGLLQDEPE